MSTRWNSLYLTFARAKELKAALVLYFIEYKIDKDEALTNEDWDAIETFTEILEPLFEATKELSAEQFTTLSKVVPLIDILLDFYSPKPEEDNELGAEFRQLVYDGLAHYFEDIENNETYTNPTIFDPRFKNLVFTMPSKANQAVRFAKAEAVKVAHKANDNDNETNETDTDTEEPKRKVAKGNFWAKHDSKSVKINKKAKSSDHFKDCVDSEMRKYLSLPKLDRLSCPIAWWKNVGQYQFPYLFECAKKYLCQPATSVPSERVFSKAGYILNKKRASLGKPVANMLITLHHNLK